MLSMVWHQPYGVCIGDQKRDNDFLDSVDGEFLST
jgi:hypothetical protein